MSFTNAQRNELNKRNEQIRKLNEEIEQLKLQLPLILQGPTKPSEHHPIEFIDDADFKESQFSTQNQVPAKFLVGRDNCVWTGLRAELEGLGMTYNNEYNGASSPTTAYLNDSDMDIFGFSPLQDDFEIVSCNICKKPILKPRFPQHFEKCTLQLPEVIQPLQSLQSLQSLPLPEPVVVATPVVEETKKRKGSLEKDPGKPLKLQKTANGKASQPKEKPVKKEIEKLKIKISKPAPVPEPEEMQGLEENPLQEAENITLVLDSLATHSPIPLASKRNLFSYEQTLVLKVRGIVTDVVSRQHSKIQYPKKIILNPGPNPNQNPNQNLIQTQNQTQNPIPNPNQNSILSQPPPPNQPNIKSAPSPTKQKGKRKNSKALKTGTAMSPPPNQNQPTPATQPPQQNMVQNPQVGTTDSVKKKAVPKSQMATPNQETEDQIHVPSKPLQQVPNQPMNQKMTNLVQTPQMKNPPFQQKQNPQGLNNPIMNPHQNPNSNTINPKSLANQNQNPVNLVNPSNPPQNKRIPNPAIQNSNQQIQQQTLNPQHMASTPQNMNPVNTNLNRPPPKAKNAPKK